MTHAGAARTSVRVLGIETSCDETSASVVALTNGAFTMQSLVILSQDVHRVFGGIVPELASRQHLTSLPPVVREALQDATCELADLDAIAVTHAPGLVGALLVGVHFAKALGLATGRPVIPVNHLEGHLFATVLEHPTAAPPFTALLVSGGHTLLLDVPEWGRYQLLGQTRDDAVGEAFDKVAKLLGLPYPGGRLLEELATAGDSARYRFARPMLRRRSRPGDADFYDLSFSGLKTALLLAVQQAEAEGTLEEARPHLARGFQDAVTETLVAKTMRATRAFRRDRIVLGGGVACNRALQLALELAAAPEGAALFAPPPRLATDNAAMIAAAGAYRYAHGAEGDLTFSAHASRAIPGIFELASEAPPHRARRSGVRASRRGTSP